MFNKVRFCFGASVISLACIVANSAAAQTGAGGEVPQPAGAATDTASTTAESVSTDDIVVTARFVREDLQKTPIAITALSSAALAARGFSNVIDVAKVAPNVTLINGGGGANGGGKATQAFIRGVGQNDFSPGYEPGVGFYLDDVYYGALYGSTFSLGDIDHVEVLRGPQGTLFGKNNEGGAVRVYTTVPKGDNSGYVELGYGSYRQGRIRGAFDVPIIPEKLLLRLSGGAEKSDGYVDLIDFACQNPAQAGNIQQTAIGPNCRVGRLGGSNVFEFRAALRYIPTADLKIDVTADMTHDDSEAAVETLLGLNLLPGSPLSNANQYLNIPLYGIPLDTRFIPNDPYVSYANFCELQTGRCIPRVNTLHAYGIAGRIAWSTPWGVQVKNVIAYRKASGRNAADPASSPIPLVLLDNRSKHDQFSEELSISGTALAKRLEWTVGGFYYHANSVYSATSLFPGLQVAPPPVFGTGAYGLDFTFRDPSTSKNISAFAHVIYHVTDRLSLELGARYSREDKSYATFRRLLPFTPINPIFNGDGPFPGFENNPSATTKTRRVDPKAAIQYQWSSAVMTYIQYSTGYKGGGVNPRPVFREDLQPFGPETLKAFEAGVKMDLFDRRLRFNAAAFLNDYRDLQTTIIAPSGGSQVVNTGHVRLTGAEAEATIRPAGNLEINLSAGYLDYKTLSLGAAAGVPGGPTLDTQPTFVPKWKLSAGAQYPIDLGSAGSITPRVDWNYQSKVYFDPSNNPLAAQPGYGVVNLRLGWQSAEKDWSAAIQISNLTDKLYYLNKEFFAAAYGYVAGQPAMPRTVSVSLRRNF